METVNSIASQALRDVLLNSVLSSGALAIGTTKSKVKTAAIINYSMNGLLYTKAATDDLFVFTDLTVQPVLTTAYYLLCLDSSGNASIVNGTPKLTADITAGKAVAKLPAVPAGKIAVGALKIVLASTATFTPATTLLDAANTTVTYYNLQRYPLSGIPGTV